MPMNAQARLAAWILWIAPFALLAALIGWETDWGNALRRQVGPAPAVAPAPVAVSLFPEIAPATADAQRETIERTLFNPTRRPAPPPVVADTARPRMQRGQFTLAGTTVVGDKAIAFLREAQGGKARTARQGESINGMLVAEVKPDRVKLTLGDESEEIVLRVAAGPRTTIQPVVAPPAQQAAAAPPGGPGGPARATPAPVAEADVAARLAERRRAARAAQEAAQQAAAGSNPAQPQTSVAPTQPPAPGSVGGGTGGVKPPQGGTRSDVDWSGVYQRYQTRPPR